MGRTGAPLHRRDADAVLGAAAQHLHAHVGRPAREPLELLPCEEREEPLRQDEGDALQERVALLPRLAQPRGEHGVAVVVPALKGDAAVAAARQELHLRDARGRVMDGPEGHGCGRHGVSSRLGAVRELRLEGLEDDVAEEGGVDALLLTRVGREADSAHGSSAGGGTLLVDGAQLLQALPAELVGASQVRLVERLRDKLLPHERGQVEGQLRLLLPQREPEQLADEAEPAELARRRGRRPWQVDVAAGADAVPPVWAAEEEGELAGLELAADLRDRLAVRPAVVVRRLADKVDAEGLRRRADAAVPTRMPRTAGREGMVRGGRGAGGAKRWRGGARERLVCAAERARVQQRELLLQLRKQRVRPVGALLGERSQAVEEDLR